MFSLLAIQKRLASFVDMFADIMFVGFSLSILVVLLFFNMRAIDSTVTITIIADIPTILYTNVPFVFIFVLVILLHI